MESEPVRFIGIGRINEVVGEKREKPEHLCLDEMMLRIGKQKDGGNGMRLGGLLYQGAVMMMPALLPRGVDDRYPFCSLHAPTTMQVLPTSTLLGRYCAHLFPRLQLNGPKHYSPLPLHHLPNHFDNIVEYYLCKGPPTTNRTPSACLP